MKFKTTKGKEIAVDIRPSNNPVRGAESKSQFQNEVGSVILERWPNDVLLEEFFVPGEGIYLDYFLPRPKVVIEADGRQHSEFVPFFHGTKSAFKEAQARDDRKTQFCKINGIKLIRVPHDAKVPEIKALLYAP